MIDVALENAINMRCVMCGFSFDVNNIFSALKFSFSAVC